MNGLVEAWRLRRARKHAQEIIRHARHVCAAREDLLGSADLEQIARYEASCRDAIRRGDREAIGQGIDELYAAVARLAPARSFPGLRENLEVLVVAVSVAMAFRAYFIQPFKIPTGSMQPTLYGIHSEALAQPAWSDRMPFKLAQWLVWGTWYRDVRARLPGEFRGPFPADANDPGVNYVYVGPERYMVPRDAAIRIKDGDHVSAGDRIWSGRVTAGDHVFVNKVAWNLRNPQRGSIMVFDTRNIPTLPQGTHYIKRMVGVPGDTLEIDPPRLLVNGEAPTDPGVMRRIMDREAPYDRSPYGHGYIPPAGPEGQYLLRPGDEVALGAKEYFALGDNTANSKDSRYWGSVPQRNLVGPAFMVYWPVSSRWGLVR